MISPKLTWSRLLMAETSSDSALSMTPVRYQLSGKVGRASLIYLVLIVALFAAPCYLYGLVTSSIMSVKLKLGIVILLGLGLGWLTTWLGQMLRCRSAFWVTLVAVIGTAV